MTALFMKEKIISTSPGVFIGLSTYKAFKGKHLCIYDGTKLIMEVELEQAWPPVQTDSGEDPGVIGDMFFKHSLRMEYPPEAEDFIQILTSK